MAGVWTAGGINSFVASGANMIGWLDTLTLRLFINNITPSVTDTVGMYTEATFPGYTSIAAGSWSALGLDGNNNYQWAELAQVWTSTGPSGDTVYGYYLTNSSGDLVMAEAAPTPFAMSLSGLSYSVTPNFYLGQILPPV